MEIPDAMIPLLMNPKMAKTDYRVLLWLLNNPAPADTKTIADAVGVKPKAVNKSLRRLKDAGLIQPGELEARKRRYVIPGVTPPENIPIPAPASNDAIEERINRIEDAVRGLVDIIEKLRGDIDTLKTANIYPVANHVVTETAQSAPIQGVKVEPPIISSSLAMLLNNKLSLQPADEFRQLFGVDVPIGADMLAVAEMIRRKKAGKLITSPLGYLGALTGKITPPPPTLDPISVYAPAVDNDLEIRSEINQLWARMTDAEVEPYRQKAREKHHSDEHKKVPIEILTRQVFNIEQMAKRGISI